MLFLAFLFTVFAVTNGNLLGLSYYFDDNYFHTFSDKLCVNSTHWDLVSYGQFGVTPPYQGSSFSIKSSRNSCTSSFPIVFVNGTLELTVYLRVVSKYSGITISVFNEHDEALVSVRYQRSNRNFVPGWALILVPIHNHSTGYVQISGQSLSSELVLIDSLRYIPDEPTQIQNDGKTEATRNHETKTLNELNEANSVQTSFLYEDDNDIETSGDGIDGSGDGEIELSTEGPDEDPEEPNTEEPVPEGDTSTDPENGGFWNAFTITFVAVGAFVGVGVVAVGAYYLGINRGVSQNTLQSRDLESIETPRIIPRARSVFSDATPYDRFSRYS